MPDPSPLQLILVHCPSEIAAEMDALCKRNFMGRTDFMMMAIRTLLDYMEATAAAETARLRHTLLPGTEGIRLPGEPAASPLPSYPERDEPLLYAAEEEE